MREEGAQREGAPTTVQARTRRCRPQIRLASAGPVKYTCRILTERGEWLTTITPGGAHPVRARGYPEMGRASCLSVRITRCASEMSEVNSGG
jgi:hypothetical protein